MSLKLSYHQLVSNAFLIYYPYKKDFERQVLNLLQLLIVQRRSINYLSTKHNRQTSLDKQVPLLSIT